MVFKMTNPPYQDKHPSRSSLVVATEGEYKGKKVDPRTGLPPGVSAPESELEIKNKDLINELRAKYKAAEPFSDEQEALRQQILKLRGK